MAASVADPDLAGAVHELAIGHFQNRVEQYLDETFRSLNRASFYAETLAERGRDAAEEQLAQWADRRYRHHVGDAVEPIARGIIDVIQTGHKSVRSRRFGWSDGGSAFPFPYGVSHAAYGIALYNLQVPGCGCTQPRGAGKFAEYGDELKIQAFVVLVDPLNPRMNSVALMLPLRDDGYDKPAAGYVALILERDGRMHSERITMVVRRDAAQSLAFGDPESPVSIIKAAGGSPCGYLGFPGAEEYVVSSLGELAEYLEDMAAKLSSSHQH